MESGKKNSRMELERLKADRSEPYELESFTEKLNLKELFTRKIIGTNLQTSRLD